MNVDDHGPRIFRTLHHLTCCFCTPRCTRTHRGRHRDVDGRIHAARADDGRRRLHARTRWIVAPSRFLYFYTHWRIIALLPHCHAKNASYLLHTAIFLFHTHIWDRTVDGQLDRRIKIVISHARSRLFLRARTTTASNSGGGESASVSFYARTHSRTLPCATIFLDQSIRSIGSARMHACVVDRIFFALLFAAPHDWRISMMDGGINHTHAHAHTPRTPHALHAHHTAPGSIRARHFLTAVLSRTLPSTTTIARARARFLQRGARITRTRTTRAWYVAMSCHHAVG